MAETRSVTVRLGMDTSQYEAAAKRAAGATKGISEGGDSAFAKIAEKAKAAGQATMDAFVGAGQAAVGLGVAALATGVSYNSLQQSSRAALTTILGSAEAANAQMDRLDTFAKTSPFSKQVWITAQQQMLGFGVQAQKVIPTLTAINDTVAAVGGNNQTVAELSYIFAQISAAGKITAEDLNQFGQRGVDAATLIGSQMGMTGKEIREAITDGSLDATDALDALAAGMGEKFGGAAANVKNTWSGAVDRIKAAWRDMSSIIADPFVGKEGGGAAVQWANSLADTMRTLQSKVGPIMQGLSKNMAGSFDGIPQMFQKVQTAIKGLDTDDIDKLVAHLKEIAPAIVGLGAGLTAGLSGTIPILRELPIAMNPFVAGIGAMILMSPQAREALGQLAAPAAILFDAFMRLASALSGPLAQAVTVAATVLQPIITGAAILAQGLAQVPGPILAIAAAFGALVFLRGPLASMWTSILTPMRTFGQEMRLQQGLARLSGQNLGAMGAGFAALRSSASGAVGGLRSFGSSLLGAVGGPAGLAITAAITAITFGLYKMGEANRAAEASARRSADAQRSMVEALKASNGQVDESVRKAALNTLTNDDRLKDLPDLANRVGTSVRTMIDAQLGVPGAADQVNAAFARQRAALQGTIDTETELRSSGKGTVKVLNEKGQAAQRDLETLDRQQAAYNELTPNITNAQAAYEAETDAVQENSAATENSVKVKNSAIGKLTAYALATHATEAEIRAQGEAAGLSAAQIDEVVGAVKEAGGAQNELASALAKSEDAANRAKQALDFFSQSLDALVGRNLNAQLAEQQLNDQVRAVEQAFKDGTKATEGHIESLVRADGTIDTTTKAGSDLFKSVNDYRSAYDNATISAYQQAVASGDVAGAANKARDAASGARERFLAMADSQGISRDVSQQLADKLGIVDGTKIDDKTFQTIAIGLDTAKSDIIALDGMKIGDKTFTVTEVREIQQTYSQLGTPGFGLGGVGVNYAGGPIVGPGTGTSDSILSRLSNGEFVITAQRYAQYKGLVNAIHAGAIPSGYASQMAPGYADGGQVKASDANLRPVFISGPAAAPVVISGDLQVEVTLRGDGVLTGAIADTALVTTRQEISRQVRAAAGAR